MSRPPAPRSVLVICTRRLGDVLLATGLIRSLRRAWPATALEVLVNDGTEAALQNNPDIDRVIVWPKAASPRVRLRLILHLFRRYSLAVASLSSDRAHFLALLAAPWRVALVPEAGQPGRRWKRWLSTGSTPVALDTCHAVEQSLRLADLLQIPRIAALVAPRPAADGKLDAVLRAAWGPEWRRARYAVVHPSPMYPYKAWTADGWESSIRWLVAQGLRVAVTGGPDAAERRYVAERLAAIRLPPESVLDLSGQGAFAELTPLLENAAVFVGPDTSVTHLAAATGTPTVAIFGPSSPLAWGPWPRDGGAPGNSPWRFKAPVQQRGNVWLLQGTRGRFGDCIPCLQEGCERRQDSRSDCLDSLPVSRVIAAIQGALAASRAPA